MVLEILLINTEGWDEKLIHDSTICTKAWQWPVDTSSSNVVALKKTSLNTLRTIWPGRPGSSQMMPGELKKARLVIMDMVVKVQLTHLEKIISFSV